MRALIPCLALFLAVVASPAPAQAYTAEEAHRIYLEAVSLSDAGNHDAAYALIEPVAEAGFAEAQHLMGYIHKYGEGVAVDLKTAAEWYRKAAGQGLAKSTYALGRMYSLGEYFKQDYEKAFELYRKAAESGYDQAFSALGYLYEKGKGTKIDLEKAEYWLKKGAESGNPDDQFYLAIFYIGQNRGDEFIPWLKRASENGIRDATYLLWRYGDPEAAAKLSFFDKACVYFMGFLIQFIDYQTGEYKCP